MIMGSSGAIITVWACPGTGGTDARCVTVARCVPAALLYRWTMQQGTARPHLQAGRSLRAAPRACRCWPLALRLALTTRSPAASSAGSTGRSAAWWAPQSLAASRPTPPSTQVRFWQTRVWVCTPRFNGVGPPKQRHPAAWREQMLGCAELHQPVCGGTPLLPLLAPLRAHPVTGNSGGPLLDSSGLLVGLNTAIFTNTGTSVGIGFAIPSDTVARVVPQLIANGRVSRPSLGVQVRPWPLGQGETRPLAPGSRRDADAAGAARVVTQSAVELRRVRARCRAYRGCRLAHRVVHAPLAPRSRRDRMHLPPTQHASGPPALRAGAPPFIAGLSACSPPCGPCGRWRLTRWRPGCRWPRAR